MSLEISSWLYMITVNKDLIMPIPLLCPQSPVKPAVLVFAPRSRERAR